MTKRTFSKTFPRSEVPDELSALFDFQAEGDDFYSGRFELTDDGKAIATAMLDGDADAAKQFVLFGQEADGSTFGYWLYEGRTLATAPIVYLGSEGTGWGALANSLTEFLSLLAVGADDFAFGASNLKESRSPAPRLKEFRTWLKETFGIERPRTPAMIVKAAHKAHPDLQKWLSAWQKDRFGG